MTLFRHTPINVDVLVCRTLPMPCPCPPAPVVPVIRTGYGLLIHLWVYCCSVLVELIEAVVSTLEKAQLLQEDLEAKTWWTTCSAVSVSEVMLLGHWVLEHLDLRMTDGYALLSPPLTPIWWFEALLDLFTAWFLGRMIWEGLGWPAVIFIPTTWYREWLFWDAFFDTVLEAGFQVVKYFWRW